MRRQTLLVIGIAVAVAGAAGSALGLTAGLEPSASKHEVAVRHAASERTSPVGAEHGPAKPASYRDSGLVVPQLLLGDLPAGWQKVGWGTAPNRRSVTLSSETTLDVIRQHLAHAPTVIVTVRPHMDLDSSPFYTGTVTSTQRAYRLWSRSETGLYSLAWSPNPQWTILIAGTDAASDDVLAIADATQLG